jgi:glucan biosynthesis protein C
VLVVLHHIALVYGPVGPFYYVEPAPATDILFYAFVVVFVLSNQAYFMGLLFLLSGHFSPGSLERKGEKTFVRDRLVRLGIPLVVFFFFLSPLAWLGLYAMPSSLASMFAAAGIPLPTLDNITDFFGLGPMWFVAMLLIFDICFAIWWVWRRGRSPPKEVRTDERVGVPPRWRTIAAFTLLLAFTSYLIRIIIPLGMSVAEFPTLGYLPQYVSFFIIGIVAVKRNWFLTIPKSMGRMGFLIAGIAMVTLFPLALVGGAGFVGNGNWPSAVYSLWDSTVAVGMSLGLITLFRDRFNYSGKFFRFLRRHSYTVYFIQAPVIVLGAVSLKGLILPPIAKFVLVSVITVPFCFAVAWLVLKIPYADRVL